MTKKAKAEPPEQLAYSFCETSAAYVWHIRLLTAVGQKLSGGANTPALCGVRVSWDIKSPIDPVLARVETGICSKCATLYRGK